MLNENEEHIIRVTNLGLELLKKPALTQDETEELINRLREIDANQRYIVPRFNAGSNNV